LPLYIKAGKFKYPGSEEGMMGLFASPFINITTVGDQLLLERFVDGVLSKPSQGVGGYRDSGVQIFQNFEVAKDAGVTFAYMYGNGSGTAHKNINRGEATHYGFLSYENILGAGEGYGVQSLKLYAWLQKGKRYLAMQDGLYNRERSGLGVTYNYDGIRIEGEYVEGRGMIGNGVRDISNDPDINEWMFQTSSSDEARASGYYLATVYSLMPKIDLVARYDRYDRMNNNKNLYRVFQTYTTGASYKFDKSKRIDLNYDIIDISAPYNSAVRNILNAAGNQLSIQFTIVLR
jgi:hypothetical protein